MSHFIESLNPAQREAVIRYDKPSLIVAGAGSGKTRVLTCRIAYMIEQGVPPGSILALTFTNKAAREMRERITALLPDGRSRYVWMGTFHSIFCRILRAEAEKLGFTKNFTIYDTGQSESMISSIIREMDLNTEDYKARAIRSRISLAKNNLVTAESYAASSVFIEEDRKRRQSEFSTIYHSYVQRCKRNNAMDFDDLLLYVNILFRDFPEVLAIYQERFRYLLVDEYQDTNYAQYLIVRRLSLTHSHVCVVGDDAQSIYAFRGAKIENILRFRSDFPQAEVFKLEENYRSTQTIVNVANSIIAHNTRQIPKQVFSKKDRGDRIRVIAAYTDMEEAQLVADAIRSLGRSSGGKWSEIAVLYRNNSQSQAIEEALRRRDIPYRIHSGRSFYERKEIRDMIAYFRLIVNPKDDEAFRRIVNTPARGIGVTTVERVVALAREQGKSLWETVNGLDPNAPEAKAIGKRITAFVEMIRELSMERYEKSLYDFGMAVAARSGIIESYRSDRSVEAESALANVEELLNSMEDFKEQQIALAYDDEGAGGQEPTIEEWLQNVALMTDEDGEQEEGGEKVVLMTVHAAKGLEFDHVFIVGLEENLFPSLRSSATKEGLEEERRLFYVALTRARVTATVSFARSRRQWGSMEFSRPSRFIREMDGEYVDLPPEGIGDTDGGIRQSDGNRTSDFPRGDRFAGGRNRDTRRDMVPVGQKSSYEREKYPAKSVEERLASGKFRTMGVRSVSSQTEVAPDSKIPDNSSATHSGDRYRVGMTVEHAKFGKGKIVGIEHIASDMKIMIIFADERFGKKTLLGKYAKLSVLDQE